MPEGKIIKALSGFYYVLDESQDKIIQCRGRGIFRKNKITPLVGDYAVYQAENDKEGYLLEIKERTNELIRPPISNVDQAVLVFSAVQLGVQHVFIGPFSRPCGSQRHSPDHLHNQNGLSCRRGIERGDTFLRERLSGDRL